MNKRLPLICSVGAVVALSASLAFWGLQLFKPKQRPIVAAPVAQMPEPNMDAGRGLFGGQAAVAVTSNYQLRGVVAAGNGVRSAAIIAADGQPAKAFGVGQEVAPGVTVKDVQPRFVILSEGGVPKRLDLVAEDNAAAGGVVPVQQPMPDQAPQPLPMQPAPMPLPMPGQATQLPPGQQPPPPPPQMAPAQPVNQNGVPSPRM